MHALNLSPKPFLVAFALSILTILLASCGGGGSNTPEPQSAATAPVTTPPVSQAPMEDPTGVVGILLKDAPTEDFTRIILRITRVELLRDDGGPVTVFEGDKEIDLLQLENFYNVLALSDEVPVGEYQKIRLRVLSITLWCLDENGNEVSAPADVPANGKVDLNPQGSFTVSAGHAVLIEIDLDAKKSIHIVGTGNDRYKFRPVVFVDIEEHEVDNGLVKINGIVGDIAYDRFFFDLCDLETQFHSDTNGCILVNVFGHTRIFDPEGEEIDFSELRTTMPVTVIGMAVVIDDDDDDVSIDDESADDDSVEDTVRMVQINALVIQQTAPAEVLALSGTVLTALDDRNLFEFGVLRGQDFLPEAVTVLVQPGTRILDAKTLAELDRADIQPGVVGEVIGIVHSAEPELLRAAVVLLKLEPGGPEKLTGIIQEVRDDGVFILTVDNEEPMGDRCIAPVHTARYFIVRETADKIEIDEVPASAVKAGLSAAVFGEDTNDDGCFEAEVIVMQEVAVAPV